MRPPRTASINCATGLPRRSASSPNLLTGIVRLSRAAAFEPDSRWIARQTGLTVDQVNVALSRLLRLRLLAIGADGKWQDFATQAITERQFRKLALARVRQMAKE